MRPVMAVMVLVMAVMACGIGFAGQGPMPAAPSSTTASPTMRIGIISLTPYKNTIVIAQQGLRVRTLPDAAGPVDSVQIAIMIEGDAFLVHSCQEFGGNWWAYGTFQEGNKKHEGWAKSEFLRPDPCQ